MRKKLLVLGLSLLLIMTNVYAEWNKNLPADDGIVKQGPAQIRANWEAIESGADSALKIIDEKVADNANISDTKLGQITTANKVSGTALTGLANIPAGAGLIPSANIPNIDGSKLTGLGNIGAGAGLIPIANIPDTVVKTTGDQNVGGIKNFTSIPVLPASSPTSDNQASRKKYVDDKNAAMGQTAGGDLQGTYPDPTLKAGTIWKHSGVQVFNGTSPTADWTDLDLSSVVGANYALVLLRIYTADNTGDFGFRPNGDSVAYSKVAGWGAACGRASATATIIIIETGSDGIVEWKCDSGVTTTINVLGYIK